MIYQQEVRAGNVLLPTLSGSPRRGYSGTVGIGLSGLPGRDRVGLRSSGNGSDPRATDKQSMRPWSRAGSAPRRAPRALP